MLKQEFDERIGRVSTDTEYLNANIIYTEADGMDKDEFCSLYKRYTSPFRQNSKWTRTLMDIIIKQYTCIGELKEIIRNEALRANKAEEKLNMNEAANEGYKKHLVYEIAGKLIDICNSDCQSAIRDYLETYIVTELIGGKDYLKYKLEHDYPLTAEDKEVLKGFLNED